MVDRRAGCRDHGLVVDPETDVVVVGLAIGDVGRPLAVAEDSLTDLIVEKIGVVAEGPDVDPALRGRAAETSFGVEFYEVSAAVGRGAGSFDDSANGYGVLALFDDPCKVTGVVRGVEVEVLPWDAPSVPSGGESGLGFGVVLVGSEQVGDGGGSRQCGFESVSVAGVHGEPVADFGVGGGLHVGYFWVRVALRQPQLVDVPVVADGAAVLLQQASRLGVEVVAAVLVVGRLGAVRQPVVRGDPGRALAPSVSAAMSLRLHEPRGSSSGFTYAEFIAAVRANGLKMQFCFSLA